MHLLLHLRRHHEEAPVLLGVLAGGQGDELAGVGGVHAGVVEAAAFQVVHEAAIVLLRLGQEHLLELLVQLRRRGLEGAQDLVGSQFLQSVKIDERMGLPVLGVVVGLDLGKHGAVPHTVPLKRFPDVP